jgi:serine protease Do
MEEFNGYEQHRKRRGRGSGWMIATLVLAAFFVGALAMKYIPLAGKPAGAEAALMTTATPQPTLDPSETYEAGATLTAPPVGDTSAVAFTQGIDIPSIVRADGPAVVGVVSKVRGNQQYSFGSPAEATYYGSGIVFRSDGYIVTNNHVVDGADSISVVLQNGEEVDARLCGSDAQTDLAVLKIDKTGLATIPFGNSDAAQVGETVIAIGNPGTASGMELAGTVTAGIISAKSRQMQNDDGYLFTNLIQTDAAINPGNSGGALVNAKGQLIGINQSKITTSEYDEYGNPVTAEGLGFALPINDAQPVISQLMNGDIPRPVLGINNPFTPQASYYNQLPEGVAFQGLTKGGPADKAGLEANNDIIEEIDGQKVASLGDVRSILSKHAVGETVDVKVYRYSDRKEMTFQVTLGSSTDNRQQQ